jgi:hypothetical protein
MTDSLTTTETTDIATTDLDAGMGYEGLGPDDYAAPFVKLVQGSSDEAKGDDVDVVAGQYLSSTGDVFDDMRIAVVHVHKERDYYDSGTEESCRSRDTVLPDASIEHPMADTCEECPKKDWINKKRECADVFAVTAVDMDSMTPFKISFKRTSYAPFRGFLGNMASKRLPLFGASVKMASRLKTKGKNTYHVSVFSDYEKIEDPDALEFLKGLYLSLKPTDAPF